MHPLDNPSWTALTTHQADVALGSELARRFPPDMAVHGGMAAVTAEAFASLSHMAQEPVGLFFNKLPQLPAGWTITRQLRMIQMLHEHEETPVISLAPSAGIVELGTDDLQEMMGVYEVTRPGRTMARRIQQLGLFLGVRSQGKLAAMAGMRLHLPGYREITTVATHPGHLSRGYATALVAELVRRIRAVGEQPFLHVRDDNVRAIQIYERLGFRERTRFDYVAIRYAP